MESLACLSGSDRTFGPRVDPACRSFDFTLLFEDVFLTCVPSAVFLALLPSHVTVLARSPAVCSVRSKLLLAKLVSYYVTASSWLRIDKPIDCPRWDSRRSGRLTCFTNAKCSLPDKRVTDG